MNCGTSTPPLVSIIVVTFNAGAYLDECLQSVFNQNFKGFELIIKDGGSTDNTLAILNKENDRISYWESKPDKGIYDAMNESVKLATGKWLYFIGADDRLLQGFSEMAYYLKDPGTIYYGNVNANKPVFSGEFSPYRLAKYAINHQTIFYPASVFKKYHYQLQYNVYADYALNLQCWGDAAFKKQYVDIVIAWYNTTGFSAVMKDEAFKRDKPQLIKKSMGWLMYLRFLYKRRKEQRREGSNFF